MPNTTYNYAVAKLASNDVSNYTLHNAYVTR